MRDVDVGIKTETKIVNEQRYWEELGLLEKVQKCFNNDTE